MVDASPPGCALTCAAQARKSPVVNARMIRCTAGVRRFMILGTGGARAEQLTVRSAGGDRL